MGDLSMEFSEALVDFQRIQNELLNIRRSPNIEETLDQLEVLLDMVVDFDYAQIYLRDDFGTLHLSRNMTAEGMSPEWAYVQWAIDNQEVTVIPDDSGSDTSILLLPLVGNVQVVGVA